MASCCYCLSVANAADCASVVGNASPAAVGIQLAREHCRPVCASAGSLGGGEDGPLPPDPRAGNIIHFPLFNSQMQDSVFCCH